MTKTLDKVSLFRTAPAKGLEDKPRVDRKAGIIYGFSVIEKGPALGHGTEIDDVMLDQVMTAGNDAPGGSKMRFTHPGMSSDGLGKYMGRAKNFRRDGDRIRADAHIAKSAYDTPSGDLGSYVLDLAEEDPKAFGASIAFRQAKSEYRINRDGTRQKDADGNDLPPLVRLKSLVAVDLVDSPAANTRGLLSEEDLPDWPARQITHVLDELFSDTPADSLRAKVDSFISTYLSNRGDDVMPPENKPVEGTKDPVASPASIVWNEASKKFEAAPGVTLSEEQLAALNPKPVEVAPAPKPVEGEQLSETDIERKRCREIMALCETGRMPGLSKGFIDAGLSIPDVKGRLFEALAAKNAPLSDDGTGEGKLSDKPNPDAKYEAEYLAEKGACDDYGISKELFIFTAKTRDGVPCEYPTPKA